MRKKRSPVSKKISILRHEGVKQDQAVATALSMKRAGRLTPEGDYVHVRSKKRAKGRR
jgi:hypothetical protein